MKSYQDKSKEYYAKLALEKKNKTIVAGRYDFDEGKEQLIVNDIIQKLDFKPDQSMLDIGCGFGHVTESLAAYLTGMNTAITLMDIPEVINAVEHDLLKDMDKKNTRFISGLFPADYNLQPEIKFDRILLYSVLHCSDDPFTMIDKAIGLLRPYGKLMLGDLPNISKKGRFLSSAKGRSFEAAYRNKPESELPFYKDHFDFVEKMKADPDYYSLIDDLFVKEVTDTYTAKGYDVYVLPQQEGLPFCNTREDILICSYD